MTAGVLCALTSGLYTTNNFLVSEYHVTPCLLVMSRSLLQLLVFSSWCLYRRENLLPGPLPQKMSILIQGMAKNPND